MVEVVKLPDPLKSILSKCSDEQILRVIRESNLQIKDYESRLSNKRSRTTVRMQVTNQLRKQYKRDKFSMILLGQNLLPLIARVEEEGLDLVASL